MILEKRKHIIHQKFSKIIALFLGGIIMIVSFLRENIFLEINAILDGYSYNNAYFYFLNEQITVLSFHQLIVLKWILTISFIVAISGLTVLIINLWFRSRQYNRMTILSYLFFYGLTALTTFLLWLTGYYTDYYFVVRKMIGFLHSPLPVFLFFSMYFYLSTLRIKT